MRLLLAAAAALVGLCNGYVIHLRNEADFSDAVDTYPVAIAHVHDPSNAASRRFATVLRAVSKDLVPKVQALSLDATSEDFQNLLPALGQAPAVKVVVNGQIAEDEEPVALDATSQEDLLLSIRRAVGMASKKLLVRKKAKAADTATPKPKPKAKPAKLTKDAKAAKPKPKPKPEKKTQEKQNHMHSDDDLLVEPKGSKVTVLTSDNFDDFLANSPLTLVKFYAPWCGHCKRMAPRFTAAATSLASQGISLAKIDQTEHRPIGSRYGVNSFPTLIIFEGSKMVQKYDGGRTQDEIEEYMTTYKNGGKPKVWDPTSTEGDPNDQCLQREYAIENYGNCCGRGNYEKPGHLPVCQEVRDEVKARRAASREL